MPEPLQIQLALRPDTTIGHLRTFIELTAEVPNTEPLDLIYDESAYSIAAIGADLAR